MEKQYEKKITWVIKNFSSLLSEKICSDQFMVGGCKWFLSVYPKGNIVDNYLSLFLEVADYGSLPSGWRRHTRYVLTIVNQNSETISQLRELQHWFDENTTSWGIASMLPLSKIKAKDSGFLVKGELKIVVEVEVLEVIGKLDVAEETLTITQTIDVNGFQLLPSQVKSVRRLFERHPEISSEVRSKNPNFRTGYMSLLLGLIDTMCQSPNELSKDDLSEAYAALGFMTGARFKLNWLAKKLDQVSVKKENDEEANETRLKEMEEELKDMKLRCLDMEDLVKKEKGKVLAAKASFPFDDVV